MVAAISWSEIETPPPLTTRWPDGQYAVAAVTISVPNGTSGDATVVSCPMDDGPAGPCGPRGPVLPFSADLVPADRSASLIEPFLMSLPVMSLDAVAVPPAMKNAATTQAMRVLLTLKPSPGCSIGSGVVPVSVAD